MRLSKIDKARELVDEISYAYYDDAYDGYHGEAERAYDAACKELEKLEEAEAHET